LVLRGHESEWHEFDEADRHVVFRGEVDKGSKLLMVENPQQDTVQFNLKKASLKGGTESVKEIIQRAPRNLLIHGWLKGIEAQIDRLDSSVLKLLGDGGKKGSIS